MIPTLVGHAQYIVAVIALLLVFGSVGVLLLTAAHLNQKLGAKNTVLLGPGVGMAVVATTLVVIAKSGTGISAGVTWATAGLTGVLGLAINFIQRRRGRTLQDLGLIPVIGSAMRWYPLISLVGLAPFLQLFVLGKIPAGFGTSVTWQNPDLGVYLLYASNVGRVGLTNSELLMGINLGDFVSFDHPALAPLFAGTAHLLGRAPHQMGIVFMATALSIITSGAIVTIEMLANRKFGYLRSMVIAVVVLNVAVTMIAGNFFISQVVSIALMTTLLAVAVSSGLSGPSRRAGLIASVVIIACYLTSPEITFVLAPLALAVGLIRLPLAQCLRSIRGFVAAMIAMLTVFAVVQSDLVTDQLDVIRRNSVGGAAGWRWEFLSFLRVGGIATNDFAGPFSPTVRLFDLFILIVVVGWIVMCTVRRPRDFSASLGLGAITAILSLAVVRWGANEYQTWKMVATLTPFAAMFLLSLAWRDSTLSPRTEKISIAVCLLVAGGSLGFSNLMWRDISKSNWINSDLVAVATSAEARRQSQVDIDVAPFFETMAAGSLVGVPVRLVSQSYYFPDGQSGEGRCTLTTRQKMKDMRKPGPVVVQSGPYVLVGTPRCD